MEEEEEATPTPTTPPRRVQPRRAAKNKTPTSIDTPSRKRKEQPEAAEDSSSEEESSDEEQSSEEDDSSEGEDSSEDDEPLKKRKRSDEADLPYEETHQFPSKKRKTSSSKVIPPSKQREIDADIQKLTNQINKLTKQPLPCIYGYKPWNCPACPLEKHVHYYPERKCSVWSLDISCESVAAEADMEVVECEMLVRWDVEVPAVYRFMWRDEEYAVDSCDGEVKVLML